MKYLKNYIRELVESIVVDGPYTHNLTDDDSWNQRSILVPDDIKDKIKKYFTKMELSRHKTKKRRARD